MTFRNKGLDSIKLGSFFRVEEVRSLLPDILNTDENLPSIVYSLEGTIRNEILTINRPLQTLILMIRALMVLILYRVNAKVQSFVIHTMVIFLQETSGSLLIRSLDNSLLVVLTSEKQERFIGVIVNLKFHLVWTHI